MTSSVSDKLNRISRCDWLPEWARWSYLFRDTGFVPQGKFIMFWCFIPCIVIINPLLTELVLSRWLDIGLILFLRVYGPWHHLGPQRCKKKNLANIQPSWPHTWSIDNPYIRHTTLQYNISSYFACFLDLISSGKWHCVGIKRHLIYINFTAYR